jgi:hypothetical protein
MVSRAEKIGNRLPHFFMSWDPTSLVSTLIQSFGTRCDEIEKDLSFILRAHWIDSASVHELDQMGAVFRMKRKPQESDRDFRIRIKMAILSYKGGGTLNAVRMMVRIILGLPVDAPVEIVENPQRRLKQSWSVRANQEWTVNPRSIEETVPDVSLKVETQNVAIASPQIVNLTTGESISFRGKLTTGDLLQITGGRSLLNGQDKSRNISRPGFPPLPRRRSQWKYSEEVGASIGVFDRAFFDQSFFAVDILSTVTFEWAARQPATFEVKVPREQLQKAGVSAEGLEEMIGLIKGAGVKARVVVIEGSGV